LVAKVMGVVVTAGAVSNTEGMRLSDLDENKAGSLILQALHFYNGLPCQTSIPR